MGIDSSVALLNRTDELPTLVDLFGVVGAVSAAAALAVPSTSVGTVEDAGMMVEGLFLSAERG